VVGASDGRASNGGTGPDDDDEGQPWSITPFLVLKCGARFGPIKRSVASSENRQVLACRPGGEFPASAGIKIARDALGATFRLSVPMIAAHTQKGVPTYIRTPTHQSHPLPEGVDGSKPRIPPAHTMPSI